MEFVRLFQTLSAINESWGRGVSAECNILKPCGGCLVQLIINVDRVLSVNPATRFDWIVQDDAGNILKQGTALGSDFQGTGWILPDAELFTIDRPVTFIATQTGGPRYCLYYMTGIAAGDTTQSVSGYYDDCDGTPAECYPYFDCEIELSDCPRG
jgi:hypothetical protein